MKIPLKPPTKNPNRPSEVVSPLLALVVATLMSATAVQANAELIVHSDANRIQHSKTVIAAPYTVSKINELERVNSPLPTDISIIKLMQVMHIDEQIQSIVDGKQAAINAINTQTQNQQINDKPLNKRQRELQNQIDLNATRLCYCIFRSRSFCSRLAPSPQSTRGKSFSN